MERTFNVKLDQDVVARLEVVTQSLYEVDALDSRRDRKWIWRISHPEWEELLREPPIDVQPAALISDGRRNECVARSPSWVIVWLSRLTQALSDTP